MSENVKTFQESVIEWCAGLGVVLRVVLASPVLEEKAVADAKRHIDPDFEGWLHGNPMVTKNPASRFSDRTPGYITGNGLGSMEIGAADD